MNAPFALTGSAGAGRFRPDSEREGVNMSRRHRTRGLTFRLSTALVDKVLARSCGEEQCFWQLGQLAARVKDMGAGEKDEAPADIAARA